MADLPKRERKQAELYKVVEIAHVVKSVSIQTGKGIQLSEYPFFLKGLEKIKGDDDVVKSLHLLLFGSTGKKLEAKKNIRLFSGFVDEKSKDEKLAKVMENKKKWTMQLIKDILSLFGMEKTGTRSDLIERMMDYLMAPSSIKEDGSSGSKKSSKSATTKGTKRKAKGDGKAPKKARAPSAYILFSADCRAEVKGENPDATFAELSALLGQKWKAIDEDEKKKWTDIAAEKAAAMKESEEGKDEGDVEDAEEEDVDEDDEKESGEDLFGDEIYGGKEPENEEIEAEKNVDEKPKAETE